MSQLEEAVARLTQARSKLAPITDRILDIETRLTVAAAADMERPAKVSLRHVEFVRSETATFALDHDDRKVWNGRSPNKPPLGYRYRGGRPALVCQLVDSWLMATAPSGLIAQSP
jgi:hypothetical protein